MPAVWHIGLYTPAIILIYGIGIRSVFLFEKRRIAEFVGESVQAAQYGNISTKDAVNKYILNALFIIGAATYLPFIGDRLAEETGLGRSFIGTVFIAMTTSLPEVVVSVSALKIGATDMAIANLFGSNIFNILILAADDIFYTKASLLADVSGNHAVTGFMAVLMTGIAVVSLIYRLERKTFLRLGWDAIAILMAYIVNIYLLYSLRGKG
jgi:cation:H+ antiporter